MKSVVCEVCSFELYSPIAQLTSSAMGLYNDARFPGRSLLVLSEHAEHLEDLNDEQLMLFMVDVRSAVKALKVATGSTRVNVAILGNREAHVHAHLIPRYPAAEAKPDSSPWDDPREKTTLPDVEVAELTAKIIEALN